MTRTRTICLGAVVLSLAAPLAPAQPAPTPPAAPRPRLGIALSGGGARGAAHVGVLKVLEELRIPVDVIAGASMGSIIGGLYATGMSPQEMEDVLATMDWDGAFVDKVPRQERPFRRKQDEANFLTKLVVGIENGKIALPSGLVEGQKLNFILRSLTLPSALVDNFDRLNIPYRATATDASTGEKVVLSRGNVADAMRASMAFPGLFAPVELDGKLLVDGGVAENFPVQTAREAGAEVLVAVNIGTPLAGKEKLTSLLKIVNQVTNVATARNVAQSKAEIGRGDVFIEPDLGTISFISFDRAREAAACGERAARAHVEDLKRFSVSEEEYRAWKERTRRKPSPPPEIASVELVNGSPLSNAVLREHVRSKPGPFDIKTLEGDLNRLNAIGEFSLVDFRIVPGKGGNVLQIVLKDRTWGRTSARFGINLNTDLRANNSFELAATLTRTSVNRTGAEWRLVGGVGETTGAFGEFWQPLTTRGKFFVAPMAEYDTRNATAPTETALVEYQRKSWAVEGDVGWGDGTFAELRLGVRYGKVNASPNQEGTSLASAEENRGTVVAKLLFDSRDNVSFPRSGGAVKIEMDWQMRSLGSDVSLRRLTGAAMWAGTFGKNTVELLASGGSPLGTDLPYYDGFSLGGFRKLSGYRPNVLAGLYMGFASLTYLREISRLPAVLGGGIYLGASLEAGNTWNSGADVSFSSLHPAGSVFLGADTPLGPLYLAAGLADGGHTALYVVLGYPF